MIRYLLDKIFGCSIGCYGGYIENGKLICPKCGKIISEKMPPHSNVSEDI